MKKIIPALLCLLLMGCPTDNDNNDSGANDPGGTPKKDNTANPAGKLIILQAYGNAGVDSPSGVSHSFVELYNVSAEEIDLSGISLYFADGKSVASGETNAATEDEAWKTIALSGKIPAKGSFLILGAKHSILTATRYIIDDNYGDINDDALSLSRRAFKVALVKGADALTAQNPFDTDGKGAKVSGYIDMVGAANEIGDRDSIFGFEKAPARNSASQAVRRLDLTDTDDNSADFEAARYAATGEGAFTDEELAARKPRKSSAGEWNPIAPPKGEYDGLPATVPGAQSDLAGKLLILQIGSSADDDNNISHSFVELYNAGSDPIDLTGITLQYAAGSKVADNRSSDGKWQKIDLEGTIEAGRSFLILGAKRSTHANPALKIIDNSGDMNIPTFKLDNRAVKVALIEGANLLTVQNPFNMGQNNKAAGYIDMIGVINDDTDKILGYEGGIADAPAGVAPFRITKQVGVRRTSTTDTNVNKNDFATVTYSGLSSAKKEIMRPKNLANGDWDPFEEPVIVGSAKLMILQANIRGNDNGLDQTIPSPTGGGFARSIVELYNNTDDDIDLSNYSLHIGKVDDWITRVPLSGTIGAKCSFLIVSNSADSAYSLNATPRALLPAADLEADFIIGLNDAGTNVGNNWKIALMVNQPAILAVANPFTDSSLTANYVDMLGVGNNTITGFEGSRASGSAPQPPRRKTLVDEDNNGTDFDQTDLRGRTGNRGIDDDQLYKIWPRNSDSGEWDPITGLPEVHPTIQ